MCTQRAYSISITSIVFARFAAAAGPAVPGTRVWDGWRKKLSDEDAAADDEDAAAGEEVTFGRLESGSLVCFFFFDEDFAGEVERDLDRFFLSFFSFSFARRFSSRRFCLRSFFARAASSSSEDEEESILITCALLLPTTLTPAIEAGFGRLFARIRCSSASSSESMEDAAGAAAWPLSSGQVGRV